MVSSPCERQDCTDGVAAAAELLSRFLGIGRIVAVKTLLVGIAWLVIPDLTERAATQVRETWQRLAGKP